MCCSRRATYAAKVLTVQNGQTGRWAFEVPDDTEKVSVVVEVTGAATVTLLADGRASQASVSVPSGGAAVLGPVDAAASQYVVTVAATADTVAVLQARSR